MQAVRNPYIFPTIRTMRKPMRQQAYCDSKASTVLHAHILGK